MAYDSHIFSFFSLKYEFSNFYLAINTNIDNFIDAV